MTGAPPPWKNDNDQWYFEQKCDETLADRIGKGIKDYLRLSGIDFLGGYKEENHWFFELAIGLHIKVEFSEKLQKDTISISGITEKNLAQAKRLSHPIHMIAETSKEHSDVYFPKITIREDYYPGGQ